MSVLFSRRVYHYGQEKYGPSLGSGRDGRVIPRVKHVRILRGPTLPNGACA